MTRAFVAVFPPAAVRVALISAARALPEGADFRLVAPDKVHLTLKFLGDVPAGDLERVSDALAPLGEDHRAFDAVTGGFGVFPSARRARVLWAGVGEGAEGLGALAREVEASLKPLGFGREERPYVPHLTLGRARRPVAFDPAGSGPEGSRFTVGGVDLVESRSEGSRTTYAALSSYPFRG